MSARRHSSCLSRTTFEPLEGRKVFRGVARGLDPEGNVVVEGAEGRLFSIPVGSIRKANLDPELKF